MLSSSNPNSNKYMSIKENLEKIKRNLPEHVTLVAVSKTKPERDLQEAYDAGQPILGENKVQEMVDKWKNLPKDIQWHMIGHVQRNKVKYMIDFVALIHGVDSCLLYTSPSPRDRTRSRMPS